jgi:hypothetical protein
MKTVYATPKVLPKGHVPYGKISFNDDDTIKDWTFRPDIASTIDAEIDDTTGTAWETNFYTYEDIEAFCHIFTKDSHPEYFI